MHVGVLTILSHVIYSHPLLNAFCTPE